MTCSGFERVQRAAATLPGAVCGTSYGTPAMFVGGKSFARMKEGMDDVLVVPVALGLKDALIETLPDTYFETSHYAGWPAVLVRLDSLSDPDLAERLQSAWREKAPKRMVAAFDRDATE